MLSMHSSLFG